jgi:hypothetical protein
MPTRTRSTLGGHRSSLVLIGVVALLLGGCGSHDTSGATRTPGSSPAPSPGGESAKQTYLDAVNGLCDKLLPKVIRATHGGSMDITAQRYLADWPAHRRVLADFDTSLAAVPVPDAAAHAATAMRNYVTFADRLDAARLKAAKQGEQAWRHEVSSEKNVESDPAITARSAAGFADSCDAR